MTFCKKYRLIYIFQNNIINNKKYLTYFEWFEFAERTRNKKNTKEDFVKYEKNEAIMAAIERLRQDTLVSEDFKYIDDWDQFEIEAALWNEAVRKEAIEEGMEKGLTEVVINAYLQGLDITLIASITKLSVEDVNKIIADYIQQNT